MKEKIVSCLKESSQTIESLTSQAELIAQMARMILETYQKGGKLLVFGNGGSAADSQHFADELVGRFERNRPPLPALALTTNSSDLTSIGNDFGFEEVFSRQLEAHAKAGDIVVAISTSGNSPNVLKAIETARRLNLKVLGLSGKTGGKMKDRLDLCLCVPSPVTSHIQEAHITVIQAICGIIEESLFPNAQKAH